jgi:hypothetical protein
LGIVEVPQGRSEKELAIDTAVAAAVEARLGKARIRLSNSLFGIDLFMPVKMRNCSALRGGNFPPPPTDGEFVRPGTVNSRKAIIS